jgi:hypothetical protein
MCRPTSCAGDVPGRERPPSCNDNPTPASSQGSLTPCLPASESDANTKSNRTRSRTGSAPDHLVNRSMFASWVDTVSHERFQQPSSPRTPGVAGAIRLSGSFPNRQGAPRGFARACARLTALTVRPRSRGGHLLPTTPIVPMSMTMMTNTRESRAAELLNPIDGDQPQRYPRSGPLAAACSRFASPDAKLIRFVGRKPRPGLPILTSPPVAIHARYHAREEANPHRDFGDVTSPHGAHCIPPAALVRIDATRRCSAVIPEPHAVLPAATHPGVPKSPIDLRVGQAYHGRQTTSSTRTTEGRTQAAARVP